MKKKLSILIAALIICISLLAPAETFAAAKASIKLNASTVSLSLSEQVTLKATVTGSSKKVTWSSSNKNVAKVNQKGVVTPVDSGRAVITAKANGKTAKCTVSVYSSNIYLSDFRCTSDIDKFTMGSPYKDNYTSLSQSSSSVAYSAYYQCEASQYKISTSKVIKTLRGITLGATKKAVIAAYGEGQSEVFNKDTDKMYQIEKQSHGDEYYNGTKTLKNAKTVLVYPYSRDSSYAIRFYFNSKNKLIAVVYTKNYNSFSNFGGWVNY